MSKVTGDFMTISVAQFRQRAEVLLDEEQRKANPDNALVSFICEAVRLSREHERVETYKITAE